MSAIFTVWVALRSTLANFAEWLGETLHTWGWWLLDRVWDIIGQVLAFLLSLLPQGARDYLNQRPWMGVLEFLEPVAWFVPIHECVIIFLGALLICGVIRLARWIKSCMPTVGG